MMPTLSVRTWNKCGSDFRRRPGLVLVEMLMVLAIIAMLTSLAMLGISAMAGKSKFMRRAENLAGVFQSAYIAAQETDRRYAVVLNLAEQRWVLRQFLTLDLQTLSDEEAILRSGTFDEHFQLAYVVYDDLDDTRQMGEDVTEARFYAGHGGWQFGGKVVILDGEGNPWTILVYRAGRPVQLFEGDIDVAFLKPTPAAQLPF